MCKYDEPTTCVKRLFFSSDGTLRDILSGLSKKSCVGETTHKRTSGAKKRPGAPYRRALKMVSKEAKVAASKHPSAPNVGPCVFPFVDVCFLPDL